MKVLPFDPRKMPSPWREVLMREVERLKRRKDVLAIGIAGSWAYDDPWDHSDLDIEVVLRGDHDFTLLINEAGEVGVDTAFFGENIINNLPYETRPLYDPGGVMTRELESRDLNTLISTLLENDLGWCQALLRKAEEAYEVDPRSTLVFLHVFAWVVSEVLTVAAGDHRTVLRRCSRLERALTAIHREELTQRCGRLFGFPDTLEKSTWLLEQIRDGYREIWSFFSERTVGPPYMIHVPSPDQWFRNRNEPVFRNDARDLVWIVYAEFPSVTSFLLRSLTEEETLPLDLFGKTKGFTGSPRRWVDRHLDCLRLIDASRALDLIGIASSLVEDARELADERLYLRLATQ